MIGTPLSPKVTLISLCVRLRPIHLFIVILVTLHVLQGVRISTHLMRMRVFLYIVGQ